LYEKVFYQNPHRVYTSKGGFVINLGGYHVCILDLFTDDKTGKLAGTKIWNNIANIILSKAMLTNTITWELMAAYGAVVGGSHVATTFIKYKYGGGNANTDDDSTVSEREPKANPNRPRRPRV
jgi:hypothetical protein